MPKIPIAKSLWFSVAMSVVSIVMTAEYAVLVLTRDDSISRIVVLCVWAVMAVAWTTVAAIRFQRRRRD